MAPSISDCASDSDSIPMNFAHMYANISNVFKAECVFTYAGQLICVRLDKIAVD